MAPTVDLGPLPSKITGSCLCKKIAYRIDFPEKHDFTENVLFMYPRHNRMPLADFRSRLAPVNVHNAGRALLLSSSCTIRSHTRQ